ncbi:hypothetical protein SLS56_008602 [Neofusicoccum ribis]|uniref:AB hydrolase-1 domain-containing protein n=1 Tax=Neofusicoccum ribis TaxID=45134 RepID=A0ABR3SJP0_9PEZI
MIGTSTSEYLFIRACVFFLRAITPLCLLYWVARFVRPAACRAPVIIDRWTASEALFYLLFYVPRKYHLLQRAALHPPALSRDKRWRLFERCSTNIPDYERYLRGWFNDAPLSEIKRENVKEFLTWAFLNTGDVGEMSDDEFEGYIRDIEKRLGSEIETGRGNAKCLRLSLDKVSVSHRSLIWYLCVFVVDTIASARLSYYKFLYYRTSHRHFFSVFPLRPHNLFAKNRTPSNSITYWYRPHTSAKKLPIVFIHGIGIGLYPYVNFLREINACSTSIGNDDVGIIALEIMPISFRITSPVMQKEQMCAEINRILNAHGWDKFILASHSYGSVISTHMLHDPTTSPKIASVLLIDPVTLLLHLPDVAYNFMSRKPARANEHQLSYFASKDMGVAHTLSRCFFWSENILWKDDLAGRDATVSLAGRDLIVDAQTVGAYLVDRHLKAVDDSWKERRWVGKGVDVLWFAGLDHAQVFDGLADRAKLIDVLKEYCKRR